MEETATPCHTTKKIQKNDNFNIFRKRITPIFLILAYSTKTQVTTVRKGRYRGHFWPLFHGLVGKCAKKTFLIGLILFFREVAYEALLFCLLLVRNFFWKEGPNFSYPTNFSLETTLFCQIGRKTQQIYSSLSRFLKDFGKVSKKIS